MGIDTYSSHLAYVLNFFIYLFCLISLMVRCDRKARMYGAVERESGRGWKKRASDQKFFEIDRSEIEISNIYVQYYKRRPKKKRKGKKKERVFESLTSFYGCGSGSGNRTQISVRVIEPLFFFFFLYLCTKSYIVV